MTDSLSEFVKSGWEMQRKAVKCTFLHSLAVRDWKPFALLHAQTQYERPYRLRQLVIHFLRLFKLFFGVTSGSMRSWKILNKSDAMETDTDREPVVLI